MPPERSVRAIRPARHALPASEPLLLAAVGLSAGASPLYLKVTGDKLRLLGRLAPLILVAHLMALVALLLAGDGAGFAAQAALAGAILGGDVLLVAGFRLPIARGSNPATISRLLILYGAAIGVGWATLGLLAPLTPALLIAQICAAAVTLAVLSASPPAAIAFAVLQLVPVAVRLTDGGALALVGGAAVLLLATLLLSACQNVASVRRRIESDEAARRASRLLAEFEENRRGWFWETDARGNLTYISAQLAEAIGSDRRDLIGRPFTDLVMSPDECEHDARAERTLGFHLSTRLAFTEVAVRAVTAGEPRWWSLSGRPAADDYGNFVGFRGNGTDLTEMRRSEAEINRLARYDALTGLPNRLVIRQTIEVSLRDAHRPEKVKPCGLFMLDLDRFKNVNDTLGHPVGDVLLRQVAERLLSVVGEAGRVGRLGGDEFQVVLPALVDQPRLGALADAVIERLSAPYMIDGSHVSIGTSIGIAIAPHDGSTADSLVRNADLALYAAKAAGRGVHRFYQPEMHANAKDRRLLEIDLRGVLGAGELHLVYQPVVNTRTEKITGFEALARWDHPTRGPVSPASFIPIAEEIGLIPQIGEWVLRTACMEAANWPESVRVAVNISPIQFANPALPAIVMSALAASGLPAQRLELEITEGVFLSNSAATDAMFARLKAIGVRFALDDFGTGYSSLGYLKKAPFDKIKIDQSFVRGAAIAGSRNAAIIKAIVSLAESLGMETTAEGAETHDELNLIRDLGCSHIQGYIFGRPMPAAEALVRASGDGAVTADGFSMSRSPRVAVLRAVTLHHEGRVASARLRNVSTSGALLEIDRSPAPGSTVTLALPDGAQFAGTVEWAQDGRFGMSFARPFDLDRLNAPRAPVRALRTA